MNLQKPHINSMHFTSFIKKLLHSKTPLLAVLIDPDKYNKELVLLANKNKVSCFLVGGSKLTHGDVTKTVREIKKISSIPVILFPGDETQLTKQADGVLLLSLLSGRNTDYLIEKHIAAAPIIKKMQLQSLSTAYLLIDGGKISTTQKVTNTQPLNPKNKSYILNTCIAAEQLGFKAIYLEAGSGAKNAISNTLITTIKKNVSIPIIIGGGLSTATKIKTALKSKPNLVVIGNALEKNMYLLNQINTYF
jgi:phosphoglycerol geranylgeranyltransferase